MDNALATETVKNDHVTVKVSRGPKCHVTLEVEVSPVATEAAYHKAAKEVSKEVSIPGFRKGKAPASMISEKFGKQIDQQFRDLAIDTAVREAMNLSKLYPYKKDKIDGFKLHTLSRDKGGHLTIAFTSHPNLPHIDLKEIPKMHVTEEIVDDKKLAEVTDRLRYYHATWKPITDRPAQEGDFVRVDMVALTEPRREVFSQKTVKLDEKGAAPWIRRALIGANPGQTVEAMSEKADTSCDDHSCSDPSHHHADEQFIPTPCSITLHEITLPELPEIDEAFAQKMGCATLEEFDGKLHEYAASLTKGEHRNKLRNAMYDFLVKHYPFEIPGPLVDDQVNEYVKGCVEELAPEARTDAARALIQREAAMIETILKKNIHTDYLVGQLAHQFGLNITQQEIQQDVIRELMQNPVDPKAIDFDKYSGDLAQKIARERLVEKALDFLIDNAGKEKA